MVHVLFILCCFIMSVTLESSTCNSIKRYCQWDTKIHGLYCYLNWFEELNTYSIYHYYNTVFLTESTLMWSWNLKTNGKEGF